MQYAVPNDCLSVGRACVSRLGCLNAATFLAACLLLASGLAAWCQESRDPLLDLMIQKGMLTQDEARKVKAEADVIRTNALSTARPTPKPGTGWNWTEDAPRSGSACAATCLTTFASASGLKHR